MKVKRIERHLIKKYNPMWKIIDYYCFQAKNVYNIANYLVRQEFISTGKWLRYYSLDNIMHRYPEYYLLGSQASQNILMSLDYNWNSFFKGIKQWSKVNGEGFLGKPSLPKYKDKKGRAQLILKNVQCRITPNQTIYFSWKPLNQFSGIKTKVTGKLMQIRFVPQGNCYVMEIVYETEVLDLQPVSSIISIDLGINNFATISNNIGVESIVINGKTIKSMNQYYNKKKAAIQSETKMSWNNRLQNLTDKHRNKIDYYMHKASKVIIDYCLTYGVSTIIMGKNDGWKKI